MVCMNMILNWVINRNHDSGLHNVFLEHDFMFVLPNFCSVRYIDNDDGDDDYDENDDDDEDNDDDIHAWSYSSWRRWQVLCVYPGY